MLDHDRETKQDESPRLIFQTLEFLASRTLREEDIAYKDLIEALQECAKSSGGLSARNKLESALEAYKRYSDLASQQSQRSA